MKYSEYVQQALEDPSLIESSAQRLHRIVSTRSDIVPGYPFREFPSFREGEHRIFGLGDVINGFVKGIDTAVLAYQKGNIPLIVLTGPPSSGKTEMAKCLEDMLIKDLQVNPKYTFKLKIGETYGACLYNEDPITLITSNSTLFTQFRGAFAHRGGGNQLCPDCLKNYNNLLAENLPEGGFDSFEALAEFLDEYVELIRLPPPIALGDLTSEDFPKNIPEVIKNCNRGILDLQVNDVKFDEILEENYQTLLHISDGRFILKNGTVLVPDLAVVICANWDLDEIKKQEPFDDRAVKVLVRRNLSWRQEKKLLQSYQRTDVGETDLSHICDVAFNGMAMTITGSRFSNGATKKDPEEWLHKYAMFEMYSAGLSGSDLGKILKILNYGKRPVPEDGWNNGISFRRAIAIFDRIEPDYGNCIRPSDIIGWINSLDGDASSKLKNYVIEAMSTKCMSDITFAYVALMNGAGDANLGLKRIDKLFEKYYHYFVEMETQGTSVVEFEGKQLSIGEAMGNIEERLCIPSEHSDLFRRNINQFMDQQKVGEQKALPTYDEVIKMNCKILSDCLNHAEYFPWGKLVDREELVDREKQRFDAIINFLTTKFDYCQFCARDAVFLTADKLLGD